MRKLRRRVVYLLLFAFTSQSLGTAPLYADPIFGRMARLVKEKYYHGKPPVMCEDDCIEQLAENIDWLEHHIDRYGSIVAKQPDIWGEARLTKHRDEYETILRRELNQFKFKLNAAIAQSDSSFLAQALALSAATSDGTAPALTVNGNQITSSISDLSTTLASAPDAPTNTSKFSALAKDGVPLLGIEPVIELDQLSRYLHHLHELRRINEGDDTSDSPGYSMNLVRLPVSMLPGKLTRTGFGAEITVTATPAMSDDLLPTTFRNLVINDLVDQLGLPLVRTAELEPERRAREAALQQTKNQLKALSQGISLLEKAKIEFDDYWFEEEDRLKLTQGIKEMLDNAPLRNRLQKGVQATVEIAACIQSSSIACMDDLNGGGELYDLVKKAIKAAGSDPKKKAKLKSRFEFYRQLCVGLPKYSTSVIDQNLVIEEIVDMIIEIGEVGTEEKNGVQKNKEAIQQLQTLRKKAQQEEIDLLIAGIGIVLDRTANELKQKNKKQQHEIEQFKNQARYACVSATAPAGRSRRASHPLPPSQVGDVFGQEKIQKVASYFYSVYYGRHVRWAGQPSPKAGQEYGDIETRVNLLDAQKWLRAELASAYEMLSRPNHLELWHEIANPESGLAEAIRNNHLTGSPFGHVLLPMTHVEPLPSPPPLVLESNETLVHTSNGMPVLELPAVIGKNCSVEQYRHYFFNKLHADHPMASSNGSGTVMDSLAWAIVVESALLNQRLNEDIRKTFVSKGCHDSSLGEHDMSFFLPETAAKQESGFSEFFYPATRVFQEYVKCRWPIHVFAIDPREQDQNIADVSSRKRELQFALALGFANGQIGANSLTQFSRQLETQIETVSLNRTVVGFGHGNDTFGWRFFPRVQALDVPGTLGAIKQTLCGVSRDDDLKRRQLEPGMRECVAVVLMPSFVPYADFDIRTNWFKLTNPKNSALTMKDSVKLSRAITSMRNSCAQCSKCAHLYREGEVHRMMKRVDQLDRELPLQSMRAQVPYENTLGGFEMFNTGVTDLSPELIGWYGAPGVVVQSDTNQYTCGCKATCGVATATDENKIAAAIKEAFDEHNKTNHPTLAKQSPLPICEGAGTTLFLVGDNFSVHDTKVIAGGVCIPHVRLISREIMRVTIPSCVNTVRVDGEDYVAVYIATPYGVTNHLHVPVHCREGENSKQQHCKEESVAKEKSPCKKETFKEVSRIATPWRLISLPKIGQTYSMTALMQPGPSPDNAIGALNQAAERVEALVDAQSKVVPAQFAIHVQTPKTSPLLVREEASRRADRGGPAANPLRTKVRECWRNVRDKLR